MGTGERRVTGSERFARHVTAIPIGPGSRRGIRISSAWNGEGTKDGCTEDCQAENDETIHL